MSAYTNRELGASGQYPSAQDGSWGSPPVYSSMPQAQASPNSFAPSPLVTPNPGGGSFALSAVQPRGRTSAELPCGGGPAFPPTVQASQAQYPQPQAPVFEHYGGAPAPPVFSWSASPMGRTSAELPYANAGTDTGELDFTLEPHLPEGPTVYAQPQAPVFEQYGSFSAPAPEPSKPTAMRGLTRAYGNPLDVMEMFPTLFTTFCFGTFITPIVLSYHVGRDPQVLFWIGDYINWVIFLPVLYVLAHIYHTIHRTPSKAAVVICLMGSCIMILVLGERVLLDAYDRANEFAARDCETFPRKLELQRSWEAARTYYANCMVSMSHDLGISYESSVATYRIADCSDYSTQLNQHSDWGYLARLEEEHLCGGWCEPGHAIWTHGAVRDSCSSTVADIMENKIRWTMLQVIVYTIVVLGLVSMMLVVIGPSLWSGNGGRALYV